MVSKQNPKTEINAVLDEHVDVLLDRLGVRDKIYEGKCTCVVCKEQITLQNLKLIIPNGKQIKFLCDKPSCMMQFALGGD